MDFSNYKKKCPFNSILTGLNVGAESAIHFTCTLYMVAVFSSEIGSHSKHFFNCVYFGNRGGAGIRGATFNPVNIKMKGHFISLQSQKNGVIRL